VRGWVKREEDINEKLSCHRRSTSLSISYMKTKDRHVSLLEARTTPLSAHRRMSGTTLKATAVKKFFIKNVESSHQRKRDVR
jgi:hypothetical protein